MSTNRTSNYNLCQWEADDKVLRTEFNEDNRKIDAALSSLASAVGGKASSSSLNSLQTTVNGLKTSKADKSALDSLKTTVTQHTADLEKKGNCQVYTTTYAGDGTFGAKNPNSITFPYQPVLVIISCNGIQLMISHGATVAPPHDTHGFYSYSTTIEWDGNTIRWYSSDALSQMNTANRTYTVLAFLSI